MNTTELREKSADDLQTTLLDLLKDQFNLRMQKASGQLSQSHLLGEARRNIARVKMILQEKVGN